MVLARNPETGRHTALDAHIVLHEYVHGITSRLVGGPQNSSSLAAPQSQALGEGWSDYYALTIQNHLHGRRDTCLGTWSTGRAAGLRGLPYDERFPDGLGAVGRGRYTEPHAVGEIWAAALVRLNRELVAVTGDEPSAHHLGWRIVLDGLHFTPMDPTLLDARDGLLQAAADLDRTRRGRASVDVVRGVAAQFGMGRTAGCRNGPYFTGVEACPDA
jgi:extracellular elastinolytic metalloproteinase